MRTEIDFLDGIHTVLTEIRDLLYREDTRPRCYCGELSAWRHYDGKDYCEKHKPLQDKEEVKGVPAGDCNYGCEGNKHTCGRYAPPIPEKLEMDRYVPNDVRRTINEIIDFNSKLLELITKKR